jgi:hypothetical protein
MPELFSQAMTREMPSYIYLIMMADGVYKVGRTEQERGLRLSRLDSYPRDSMIIYIRVFEHDIHLLESNLIRLFKKEFGNHPRGREYFIGDKAKMVSIIHECIENHMDDYRHIGEFLNSPDLVYGPDLYVPLGAFELAFMRFCHRKGYRRPMFNKSVMKILDVRETLNPLQWRFVANRTGKFVFGMDLTEKMIFY